MEFSHHLAIVIPTKDRPRDLRDMLGSLQNQTIRPSQVIVVDGSEQEDRQVIRLFPELAIDFVRVFPPSLSAQRNAGMAKLRSDITLAGYIDDDIVLEKDAIENMLAFWKEVGPDFGGASFNIINSPRSKWNRIRNLVGRGDKKPGAVLSSGLTNAPGCVAVNLETDWLTGGATIWRREIIESYSYDEWFVGMGYMEDVDFSFKVGETYRLVVVASAKIVHNSPPIKPDRYFLLGKWQIVNRMYFVRKYRKRGLSLGKAWSTSVTMLLVNFTKGVFLLKRTYVAQSRGNFEGIIGELLGRKEQIGGFLK